MEIGVNFQNLEIDWERKVAGKVKIRMDEEWQEVNYS